MRDSEFERLYSDHAPALFSYLAYRTGDRALAEDLLADTFERALRKRRWFNRSKASAKTWLYAIAVNRLKDHLRSAEAEDRALKRVKMLAASDNSPGPADYVSQRDWVSQALARVTDEEREALALRFGGELTCKEMATVLDQPVSTVRGRLYGGLQKLRDLLA